MTQVASPPTASSADKSASLVLAALADRYQIEPLTARPEGLELGQAYRVAAAVRKAREVRGERVVGRKIGFTNRTIWDEYGVHAPIWSYVYDTTLHRLPDIVNEFDLCTFVEPRIEPEIVFGLRRAPEFGMDQRALIDCVEWVAHGFEIVQSIFPDWRFQAADTVAAFGLHGALLVGPQEPVTVANADLWCERLAGFEITLMREGVDADHGRAANVLGWGPLAALHHLIEVLAADRDSPPLAPGEMVATGTLTRALPIKSGERWSTRLDGVGLEGISVAFA